MAQTNRITSRYAALPLISLLLKLLGWLAAIMAIVSSARILFQGRNAPDLTDAIMSAGAALFYGLGHALVLIAASELIHVLLDIEANTRRAADAATNSISGTTPRL